jgi:uncharacterized protein
VGDVTAASLAPLFVEADAIDLLLIGTGKEPAFIDDSLRWLLRDAKIGCDPMTTTAAARTYNVLLNEGRRVAAALMAID